MYMYIHMVDIASCYDTGKRQDTTETVPVSSGRTQAVNQQIFNPILGPVLNVEGPGKVIKSWPETFQ